jgi:hypothetical protein
MSDPSDDEHWRKWHAEKKNRIEGDEDHVAFLYDLKERRGFSTYQILALLKSAQEHFEHRLKRIIEAFEKREEEKETK